LPQRLVADKEKQLKQQLVWIRKRIMPTERKLMPTSCWQRCHLVSMTDPYDSILGLLDGVATFSSK
jgi:hypothetical protein